MLHGDSEMFFEPYSRVFLIPLRTCRSGEEIEDGWGGLWMRVDGRDRKITAFDNMQNRSIKGTTDWSTYSVVLDVSEEAVDVSFGTLMSGKG